MLSCFLRVVSRDDFWEVLPCPALQCPALPCPAPSSPFEHVLLSRHLHRVIRLTGHAYARSFCQDAAAPKAGYRLIHRSACVLLCSGRDQGDVSITGPLMKFSTRSPSASYTLELENRMHAIVLTRLVELSRTSAESRAKKFPAADTSQHGDWSSFRNIMCASRLAAPRR